MKQGLQDGKNWLKWTSHISQWHCLLILSLYMNAHVESLPGSLGPDAGTVYAGLR
jgi:hypothetical protein